MTDTHQLQEIEAIRVELRALRKRIAGCASKVLLEEADTLLWVTEDLINKVFQSLRRNTL
jgi:hypothetical protein